MTIYVAFHLYLMLILAGEQVQSLGSALLPHWSAHVPHGSALVPHGSALLPHGGSQGLQIVDINNNNNIFWFYLRLSVSRWRSLLAWSLHRRHP